MKKNKTKHFTTSKKLPKQVKENKSEGKIHLRIKLSNLFFILSLTDIVLLIFVIILLILIHFNSVPDFSAKEVDNITFSYFLKRPDLVSSAKALAVYDATDKVMLLSKNQNLRFAPASTAKMMTALVALGQYRLNTVLPVPYFKQHADSSKMGLFTGERISVLNLLYGMMLPSGSDAADVLALNYPGGEKAFVSVMNKKAKSLGLENTYFVDPSGYSDDNYSTAYDLVRLGEKVLQNPVIRQIVKTKNITVYNAEKTIPHPLENLNELLDIPGVTGIKTGFTNEAEGVLVTSFVHNGKTYIMSVLGSKDRFQDTRLLIEEIIQDLKSEAVAS